MSNNRILNLKDLSFTRQTHGENFDAEFATVANELNANKLGYRVTRVPPGKRAWPLHAHYVNEEMFFILSGSGTVRFGEDTFPVSEGDFISAPPMPEEPHQIINDSDATLIYLCVSTMLEPEVVSYPDSEKLGVIAGTPPGRSGAKGGVFKFIKEDAGVGYWDDEN